MIGAKFNFLNKFILGGREHFINEYGDLDPHRQNIDTDRDIDVQVCNFIMAIHKI